MKFSTFVILAVVGIAAAAPAPRPFLHPEYLARRSPHIEKREPEPRPHIVKREPEPRPRPHVVKREPEPRPHVVKREPEPRPPFNRKRFRQVNRSTNPARAGPKSDKDPRDNKHGSILRRPLQYDSQNCDKRRVEEGRPPSYSIGYFAIHDACEGPANPDGGGVQTRRDWVEIEVGRIRGKDVKPVSVRVQLPSM